MVGARVHICTDEEMKDPALLCGRYRREGITVLQIVPALLREILQRAAQSPRFAHSAGFDC